MLIYGDAVNSYYNFNFSDTSFTAVIWNTCTGMQCSIEDRLLGRGSGEAVRCISSKQSRTSLLGVMGHPLQENFIAQRYNTCKAEKDGQLI